MTDSYLMDADCIHGVVWHECRECPQGPVELTPAAQALIEAADNWCRNVVVPDDPRVPVTNSRRLVEAWRAWIAATNAEPT